VPVGGILRNSGISEVQRTLCVVSIQACTEISFTLLVSTRNTHNDQLHQYTTAIRLSSGVIARDKVNVDRANGT